MQLSLLQLNINSDNFWDNLTPFLQTHDFDILCLQEVCGLDTRSGNINSKRDGFKELQKLLADRYNGELAIAQGYTSSPSAYIGNATFYKKKFHLLAKDIFPLYKRTTPFPSDILNFEEAGRVVLTLKLQIAGKMFSVLNAHCAWAKTPTEESYQTKQGQMLIDYLQTTSSPFVLSGDFNLDPKQPTIKKINYLARNLLVENNITNTLNPRMHRIKHLLNQGLEIAVDYIFTSRDLIVNKFAVLEEDLSDHLALSATIEL